MTKTPEGSEQLKQAPETSERLKQAPERYGWLKQVRERVCEILLMMLAASLVLVLLVRGGVESNPGPETLEPQHFTTVCKYLFMC